MAKRYKAARWTRGTMLYDLAIGAGVIVYVGVFLLATMENVGRSANSSLSTLIVSALGGCAFFMLQVALAIGPLARLSPVFLPLVAHRRHLSVATLIVALAHGSYATIWYHAGGVLNPLVSLFVSNPRYDSLSAFPFETLGAVALLLFFIVVATSHEFWLAKLSPTVGKRVQMLIYPAYAFAVLHVVLGAATEYGAGPGYLWITIAGIALIVGLHLAAGVMDYLRDRARERRNAVGVLVTVLLALSALDARLIAALQPAAGDGTRAHRAADFVGTLARKPYPMLRVRTADGIRTYLLADADKHGAEAALGITPDGPVKLTGLLLTRSGLDMIELAANDAVVIAEMPAVEEPAREFYGTVTLRGEIVDSKCWLGAMRPGEGKLHRDCASLCIRGGIPPMFVTRDGGEDAPRVMLLTQADGSAVPPELIIPFVGEPVRLSGTIEKRADLWLLRVDLPSLTHLN